MPGWRDVELGAPEIARQGMARLEAARLALLIAVAQNGNWTIPETGWNFPIDEDDRAVVSALDSIIVRPTGNQNPVKWLA